MAEEKPITRSDEHGRRRHDWMVLDGDELDRYDEDLASYMMTTQPTSGTYTGTIDGIVVTALVILDNMKVVSPAS